MNWFRLKKYCELTGDTENAVKSRRNNGKWAEGKHSKTGPDGKIWVNLKEVEKWVEGSQAA